MNRSTSAPFPTANYRGASAGAWLAAGTLLAGLAAPAAAAGISYPDFTDVTGLTLNGAAAQAGAALRLVPSVAPDPFGGGGAGSAFATSAVALGASTGFSTSFSFLVVTDPGSSLGVPDGLSFLVQGVGSNALGAAGQGMGYVGVTPSVAVTFRGRDPALVGVVTGGYDLADPLIGSHLRGSTTITEGSIYGSTQFAWIDYAPGHLDLYLATTGVKPGTPTLSVSVDIFGEVGSQAYVGFSAGNGGAYGSQDIQSWQLTTTVPEPAPTAMLAAGLLVIALRRRSRRR